MKEEYKEIVLKYLERQMLWTSRHVCVNTSNFDQVFSLLDLEEQMFLLCSISWQEHENFWKILSIDIRHKNFDEVIRNHCQEIRSSIDICDHKDSLLEFSYNRHGKYSNKNVIEFYVCDNDMNIGRQEKFRLNAILSDHRYDESAVFSKPTCSDIIDFYGFIYDKIDYDMLNSVIDEYYMNQKNDNSVATQNLSADLLRIDQLEKELDNVIQEKESIEKQLDSFALMYKELVAGMSVNRRLVAESSKETLNSDVVYYDEAPTGGPCGAGSLDVFTAINAIKPTN